MPYVFKTDLSLEHIETCTGNTIIVQAKNDKSKTAKVTEVHICPECSMISDIELISHANDSTWKGTKVKLPEGYTSWKLASAIVQERHPGTPKKRSVLTYASEAWPVPVIEEVE